ncbi:efflux RND transporter permease subunit [Desulfatibacillum aliphaticivorans]|uniref:efflux RND transporter permease subunit n=1 Tax=Desulfatibacillum aliphaticivorans TaxID=218208 RepID=UPI00041015FD|nr:efflux RND transporter permease subunit [Desulfatibacillum aliphaticivorans]
MADQDRAPGGFITGVVRLFLESKLPILFILFAIGMGAASIYVTPREEEPQIVVPLADVYVQAPGASAEEVEKLVATPLERLLWQIDGVEYVYSTSHRDMAVVTVRFFVGEDRERSIVKLHNKIMMNQDQAPPIVKGWVVKPVEIDDVPIVNLTLYSEKYDDHALTRIGQEVLARLSEVEDISRTSIVGGRKREVRVELLPDRMNGLGVSMLEVGQALAGTDASVAAGSFSRANRDITVTADGFVCCARDVENLVVGVHGDRPVYVRDIARVTDGPEEAFSYSRFGYSQHYRQENGLDGEPAEYPAVTLALAKKKGVNAVNVAQNIHEKMEELKKDVIPPDVHVITTRDYGQTAQTKVDDLLSSLFFAILTVVALLIFTLGWREAMVVALAVPISFALALFVNMMMGYTINRVTLFALILSLGLVVDDPITNVDNIQRHIGMGKLKPKGATLFAVNEVLPPVIMSTLAIIVSFTPMFFITGMMGPYMSPMAANVPLTVIFSTVCALTIVPWFTFTLLKKSGVPKEAGQDVTPAWVRKGYAWVIRPFLDSGLRRILLGVVVVGLLIFSASLALFRHVPLKMLPFDNKNEFQIILDMPEGTPLEATDRAVRAFEEYLRGVSEVTNTISYVGEPSPMDFNGMVRHYYLRKGGNMADIRVNLYDKVRRQEQSHAIVLRLRQDLQAIADQHGVDMKIVEVPPGPPVISTVVAEIYGSPQMQYRDLIDGAAHVKEIFRQEDFVVDIDDTTETPRDRLDFVLDKEKAALHGVTTEMIAHTLRMAVGGASPATVHAPGERQFLPVTVILPRAQRSSAQGLSQVPVKTAAGKMVALGELGTFRKIPVDQPIYHKNLKPVVYVFGEMAGRAPGEAILDMQSRLKDNPPPPGIRVDWAGEGEWKITLSVFRDMGLAYLAAFAGIYVLLVIQMNSFFMPVLILMAIPLTFIGIMPGFWLFNLFFATPVAAFENPVFFTATSMIGMIALGGIVIRNSLVLIEFIQQALGEGMGLKDAILQSGAVRLRPIILTAATTALGAWPITLDPIFSGLAWALIFGLFASTAFTLLVVPVTYFALNKNKA